MEEASMERRMRRLANRQGLKLEKSRTRNSQLPEYGTYRLIDPFRNIVVAYAGNNPYGMTIEDIQSQLEDS